MIRKILTGLAAVVGFTTAATAATPVAVWDGDFKITTKGDYSFAANGNTVAQDGSYIEIAANVGVLLNWPAPSTPNDFNANGNITILVKYSNWTAGASNGALATLWAGGNGSNNKDIVGPFTTASTGVLGNIWNGNTDTRGTKQSLTPAASGKFAFDYSGDAAPKGSTTYLCGSSESAFTQACTGNGTLFSTTKNIYSAAIGGSRNAYNNLAAQTGMRIEAIAIFNTRLTAAELAAYKFPSEQAVLDARVVAWNSDLDRNSIKNGDFTMTIAPDGYASVADGVATVASKNSGTSTDGYGVAVNWPASAFESKNMTVLVKYSSKTLLGGNSALFSAFWGETGREFVYSGKNNNTIKGTKWVDGSGYYSSQLSDASYTVPDAGVMLVTMKADGSTAIAFSAFSDNVYGTFTEAAKYSGVRNANQQFYGIKVAGSIANFSHYYRAGMTVQAVSVLNGAWTAANFPMSMLTTALAAYGEPSVKYAAMIDDTPATWSTKANMTKTSEADWQNGEYNTITLSNTAAADATLTFDEDVTARSLTLTSESGMDTTLAKGADATIAIARYDFSGAEGKATVGFDTGAATIAAGADTVLSTTGSGTLTIGAGKQATVTNWLGSALAGAGTVVFNADAAETAVTPGAFANGFTGSIKLTQGTWTCSGNYPETRPVTLSGENAKFVLNKQDGMGYGNNLPAFTVENGATFEVDKRDTFNRNLVLNNGNFVCKQDNNDSGRSFDFYTSAALTVSGTSTIGGLTAGSTTASGIIAIRRGNFTITVNDDAELQCYSAWATASGSGNNFKKAGAGKMVQYRDSTSALPFVVEGGTLKFVNGGRTTTAGITLNSGTKLELGATGDGSYTLANAITGAGRVEKQDSGTYVISGANTYEGTTVVKAGTLKLTGSSIGTGAYTVESGAALDFGTHRGATVAGASAGTVQITLTDEEKGTLDAGDSVDAFSVSGGAFGGTVAASDSTGAAYEINFKVEGDKIVVTKKEGAKISPFNLEVTEDEENFWESFGWKDSTPGDPQEVKEEDWVKKVGANIAVSGGATAVMTVGGATPITLSTLGIANGYKLTITRDDDATLTVDVIDDSASTGATTLDFDLGAASVAAGANTILNTVGTGAYTIGAEKKLTVKGGIQASQVSNSGTLNLEGGEEANPISITGNANLGTVTLAESTYAKNDDKGTARTYTVTGSGATSFYTISRNGTGAPGMSNGTPKPNSFSNVVICSTSTGNNYLWIEHGSFAVDGSVGLNVTGNITLSDLTTPIVVRSVNGNKALGGQAFTIKCTEAANFEGSSSQAITIDAGTAVQTFSGAYTGALTVNEGAKVRLAGSANPSSVANTGTVVLDFGAGTTNFLNASSKYNGALEVASGVAVVFDGFNGTASATGLGEVYRGYTVSINDNGKFTVPSGVDPTMVKLYTSAGTEVAITGIEGQVVSFDLPKYGTTCRMEYLFKGNLASTGSDTGSMQFDGTHCFTGYEYVTNALGEKVGGIYAASAPWRNVDFPAEVTVVMYGKVMKTDNTCQIGIGSTTGGSKYSLFLASGDVEKEEVKLCYAYNNGNGNVESKGVLCTMSVPHAQTTDHLYAFTLKKVGDDTVVNIYLDGEVLQPYTFAGKTVKLGSGLQLGSIHGGIGDTQTWPADFGFKRSTAAETDATLQFVRVYDIVLNDTVMREMAKDYPYASPAGSFSRELTGDCSWVEAEAWTKAKDSNKYDQPDAGSSVTLTPTAAEDVDLTVNIDADAAYETLTINQGCKVVFKTDAEKSGIVNISGKTTISTDVELDYDAIRVNGAVSIASGKTVDIDLTSIDLKNYWVDTAVKVTGPIVVGTIDQITVETAENAEGRTCSFAYNPSTLQTELDITVPKTDIIGTVGAENAITWTWGVGNTLSTTPDWTKVAATIVVPEGITWDYDISGMNITNVIVNGTADIGTKRGLTFAGAGTVNVTLTDAEIAQRGVAQTMFTVESGSVKVGVVRDEDGNDITSTCTISGGTVTVKKLPFMFILK